MANKRQNGGKIPDFLKFRTIQTTPVVDNLHNLVQASNNLQQESNRTRKPQETVKQITREDVTKNASIKDILTNPVTALKYKLHNQDIPANFTAGQINPYDNAAAVVNPMTYVNAVLNTGKRLAHPINTLNQIVDNPVQNGLPALADAAFIAGALPKVTVNSTIAEVKNLANDINYYVNKPKTVQGIQPRWFIRELGDAMPSSGNFNNGVYSLKRFPGYVAKLENPESVGHAMGFPEYKDFNFTEAMRNIPDEAPIAKVYNQFDVPNSDSRALIMKKLDGLSPSRLQPEDFLNMPNEAYTNFYNTLKTVKDNNLAFDYMGDNYLYNPNTKQFQLLDINPVPPYNGQYRSMMWRDDILNGIYKNSPQLTPSLTKQTIADKLTQDYTRSLYRHYPDDGEANSVLGEATQYGSNYLKQAVLNSTQHLTEFKTGGTMKKTNKKTKKFQLAGQMPCGEGTIWNGEQCVPIAPVNPDAQKLYTQDNTGTPTNFIEQAYTKQNGKVVQSNTLPLHNVNAMGPFNFINGQQQNQPNYQFDPKAGAKDGNGNFVPQQQVVGDAIDKGFNLDSDGVYRKNVTTTDKNSLGYSDGFKALNLGLDVTSLIAGKINDQKTIEAEKQKFLKARYNQSQYNPYEKGINNIPVYFKNGGGIDIKKSHEGLFTNEAKQAGMSVQEFASHVLANKDKYSPAVVKRANFAHNFAHQNGGQANTADFNTLVKTAQQQKELANNAIAAYSNTNNQQKEQQLLQLYKDAKFNANTDYTKAANIYNNLAKILPQAIQPILPPVKPVYNYTDGYQNGGSLVNNTGYTPGTNTYNNPINIIPSNQITMSKTPFPVLAIPNNGNPTVMHPGNEYSFNDAKYVTEIPIGKNGGSFGIGNHVGWNSEAGHVTGTIKQKHTKPFKVNGYTKHASKKHPVYEIKSSTTDHVAYHFPEALHKLQNGGPMDQNCPTGDCADANGIRIQLPQFLQGDPSKRETRIQNKLYQQALKADKAYYNGVQWIIDRANFFQNNTDYGKYPAINWDPQPQKNGVIDYSPNNFAPTGSNAVLPSPNLYAQNGGDNELQEVSSQPSGNAELEEGEVYQTPQGGIQKIDDQAGTHEQGGVLRNDVSRVLEDTADKRTDPASKLLRVTPTQAQQIVDFKPKGTVTHSKLYEQATDFYDKKLTNLENKINTNLQYVNNNGGVYAKRSLDLNLKLLQDIPTKADLFNKIYNHQESVKQAYGIDNQEQQNKFGGKVKFAIGGSLFNDEPVDPYSGGKTKKGRTTPTGLDNAFTYDGGLPAYKAIWKKAGLNLDSYKTNAEAQAAVYDYLLKNNPQVIAQMWKTNGNTAAGIKAGLPSTFTDDYLANPENLAKLKQGYVDNLLGRRTLTPTIQPTTTTPNNQFNPQPPADNTQYQKPNSITPSKFNEPLHWYDTAGNVENYLSSNERTPVSFEQLSRDPLRVHELNPLPALQANQGDFNAALQQLPNDGIGYANQANLLANKYKVDNEILGQYENLNKGRYDQIDQLNNANKFQLDQINLNLRDRAQQQQLAGMEAQRQSKLNAFDDYLTKIAQNNKLNREGNLILQMTPYFDQNGQFNGNQYVQRVNGDGGIDIIDKGTGKIVQTVTRDANGQILGSKYRVEQKNK